MADSNQNKWEQTNESFEISVCGKMVQKYLYKFMQNIKTFSDLHSWTLKCPADYILTGNL